MEYGIYSIINTFIDAHSELSIKFYLKGKMFTMIFVATRVIDDHLSYSK